MNKILGPMACLVLATSLLAACKGGNETAPAEKSATPSDHGGEPVTAAVEVIGRARVVEFFALRAHTHAPAEGFARAREHRIQFAARRMARGHTRNQKRRFRFLPERPGCDVDVFEV